MSTSANERDTNMNGRSDQPVVIDLTDEDNTQQPQQSDRLSIPLRGPAQSDRAAAGSSRAQRLPRWDRALVNSPSSGEEQEDPTNSNLFVRRDPGLPLPLPGLIPRLRPSSRRPVHVASPTYEMDDDDVEVVTSNAAPLRFRRVAGRVPTPASAEPSPSVTPHPTSQNETIDLTQDDDDEVVHLDTRQRPGAPPERPISTASVGTRGLAGIGNIANIFREQGQHLGGRLMQRLNGFAGLDGEIRAQEQAFDHFRHNHGSRQAQQHHHHHNHQHRHHHQRQAAHAALAGNLADLRARAVNERAARNAPLFNFDMTGFDMGMGGNRPPTPKYSPPPEAEPGFTRSPGEDEVVVCPNCGDELAMGDSDIKQELWVIKSCGHVYCGECAQNRSRTKGKKGKGKATILDDAFLPPPFKSCVVEGCNAPASSKSMVLVYLGS